MKEKSISEAGGANNSPASPVSLETMIGRHNFEAQGRVYILMPIKLKHLSEFRDKSNRLFIASDNVSDGYGQFSFLAYDKGEDYERLLDKWLRRQLKFNDEPVTYQMIADHEWDIDDLGRFLKEMARVSG